MLTKKELEKFVVLNQLDWCLYWKPRTQSMIYDDKIRAMINKQYAWKKAGYDHKGYIRFRIGKELILAHRAIWCLYYGEWPDSNLEIDHKDGNRKNNNISNLRLVEPAVNSKNRMVVRHDNETKLLGVGKVGNKFRARIRTDQGRVHLGCFDTAIEAHFAYVKARRVMEHSTL